MSNSSVTEQVEGRQDVFSSVSSLSVIEFDMGILGEKIQVLSRGVVPYYLDCSQSPVFPWDF